MPESAHEKRAEAYAILQGAAQEGRNPTDGERALAGNLLTDARSLDEVYALSKKLGPGSLTPATFPGSATDPAMRLSTARATGRSGTPTAGRRAGVPVRSRSRCRRSR
jgi:hypothetical protein